jgi:hypothetical protein
MYHIPRTSPSVGRIAHCGWDGHVSLYNIYTHTLVFTEITIGSNLISATIVIDA